MTDGTVLLTGASGLLGTWLRRTVPAGTDLVALTHTRRLEDGPQVTADLRDAGAVTAAFRQVRPTLVIHAAYTRDRSSIVDAAQNVVDAARAVEAYVLHISTDAVFSGDGSSRSEVDRPDPVSDYGRWKAQAEQIALQASSTTTIVRLPLIVSLEPEDHVVERIHAGASQGEPTPWFDDEMRQPAEASDLAGALWDIASLEPTERAGTWHLPGPEILSRFEIAQRVVRKLDLEPGSIVAEPTPRSAERPSSLDLLCDRARTRIDWSPSSVLR